MTTSARYAEFGAREARGESPIYERLALAVSVDEKVLAFLGTLPPAKRQPNLLFGVVRFLGGPVQDPAAFSAYVSENWPAIEAELRVRATQTNEAGAATRSIRRPGARHAWALDRERGGAALWRTAGTAR